MPAAKCGKTRTASAGETLPGRPPPLLLAVTALSLPPRLLPLLPHRHRQLLRLRLPRLLLLVPLLLLPRPLRLPTLLRLPLLRPLRKARLLRLPTLPLRLLALLRPRPKRRSNHCAKALLITTGCDPQLVWEVHPVFYWEA